MKEILLSSNNQIMSNSLEKLFIPRSINYIIINSDCEIIAASPEVSRFAEQEDVNLLGSDIRASFPEFIGIEAILSDILLGKQESFALAGISRTLADQSVIYFDWQIEKIENNLFCYLQDVTENMHMQQALVQSSNESELLLNALKISQAYLSEIFVSMGDSLIVTNQSDEIIQVNRSATELFGYTATDLQQKSISLIIKSAKEILELKKLAENSQKTEKTLEVSCQTREKQNVVIEFNCFLVATEVKDIFNYVYIGRDITAKKQAEAEVLQALAKQKELNELKSRFVSATSHEFRNPLSSILVCTDLLTNAQLPREQQLKYVGYIKIAATSMKTLLEDILTIGKAEAGKLTFKPELIDIVEFCQTLITEIELINQSIARIDFNLSANFAKFSQVSADPKLLRHIVTNILSNALKYSPVREKVKFDLIFNPDLQQIQFIIQDKGIGIPEQDYPHLFESFHRSANVGDIAGTGLGLSIVKKAVELHAGEILVESKVNQGTTVTVILPYKPECN